MYIIPKQKDSEGKYAVIQSWNNTSVPSDFYAIDDALSSTIMGLFIQFCGFLNLTITDDIVTNAVGDEAACEAWKEAHPVPEPDPGDSASAEEVAQLRAEMDALLGIGGAE